MEMEDILNEISKISKVRWVLVISEKIESGFTTLHITKYELYADTKLIETFQEASTIPDPKVKKRLDTITLQYLLRYVRDN